LHDSSTELEVLLAPSSAFDVLFNIACLLITCGRYSEATEHLQDAVARAEEGLIDEGLSADDVEDECAGMKVQLAYVQQKQLLNDEAMSLYQQTLKEKPSDVQVVTVAQNNCIALKKAFGSLRFI